ncbi:MAG: SDR family NAD(P)-dependent oxidoreductase [Bacteroidetes bacterium]|nr:SDR family NAD(P)-dependent oxidoreductase [Bacteroidota bacterium]
MPEREKVVFITGAGRGLGKALTLTFLSKGWWVVATDLEVPVYNDPQSFAWFAGHPELKNHICPLQMDVTSDESVASALSLVKDENFTVDLIINNAGIDNYFLLSEAPVSEFKRIFEVNVFGAYRVNQVFLPLVRRPGGRIIHIGSESLNLTMPFMAYPLSKKLVEGYAKALRQELRFHGIDVVVIRPGAINTELLKTVSGLTGKADADAGSDNLRTAFHAFASQASKEIGKVLSPQKVAEFIYSVSYKTRPKAVYRINNMLQLRIAALLPFSLLEQIVHKRLSKTKP